MAALPRYIATAFSASLLILAEASDTPGALEEAVSEGASSTLRTLQDLKQGCRYKPTPYCFKIDLLRLLDLLSRSPPFEILPGVKVSSRGFVGWPSGRKSLFEGNASVDEVLQVSLSESLSGYLRSLTIQVPIYNEETLDYVNQQAKITGRGKKTKFLSIYTVFAMAFALLSALLGKAMTLSVVSIVISMMTRNAIGLGNAPANSPIAYDIVRRPQIQLAQTQSHEDVYEGAHSYPAGYVYPKLGGRSINEILSI